MAETPISPKVAFAAWYLNTKERLLWLAPMSAGMLVFTAVLLLRSGSQDAAKNFASSQAALAAFNREPLEKDLNALTDYKLGFSRHVPFTGPDELSPSRNFSASGEYFSSASIVAFLKANQATITSFKKGAQKECDWGFDYRLGEAVPARHLGEMRNAARLLAVEARAHAHSGDHARAAESIDTIYRMALHLSSAPLTLNGLVSIAMTSLADRTLENIIVWDTPATLKDIESYRRVLSTDRKLNLAFNRQLDWQKKSILNMIDLVHSGSFNTSQLSAYGLDSGSLRIVSLSYASDRECATRVMDELIESTSRGEFRHPLPIDTLIDENQTGPAPLTRAMTSYLGRMGIAYARSEDYGRLIDAAFKFLEFRVANGRDPESLKEFLAVVPHGRLDGQPLRMHLELKCNLEHERRFYKLLAGKPAVRLYFLDENGVDDLGRSPDDHGIVIPVPSDSEER